MGLSFVAGMDNNTTMREADVTQEPGDAFSLLFEIFIGEFLNLIISFKHLVWVEIVLNCVFKANKN